MATFSEIRFPTDISIGATGGPEFSTDVVTLQNGHEKRNANWQQARARYNIAHGIKDAGQLAELKNFFMAKNGKAMGFRYKDWTDYTVVGQAIGIGDATTTDFQLVKTYSSGSETYTRIIAKPVSGTVDIYVDAVLQSSGVSVDTTTGIISFDAAPAGSAEITADFEFDVPVRFDTDLLEATMESFATHSWRNIELVEIRV